MITRLKVLLFVLLWAQVLGQTYEFDDELLDNTAASYNPYVDMIEGNINIMISAPHGGTESIDGSVPRSECNGADNDATLTKDTRTFEVAKNVWEAIVERTGYKPWFVGNRAHREFIDVNRASMRLTNEGTESQGLCGQPTPDFDDNVKAVFNKYWDFIDEFKGSLDHLAATDEFGLLIDIHAQGHRHKYLEVGMGVTKDSIIAMSDDDDYTYNADHFRSYTLKNSAKMPVFGTVQDDAEKNTVMGEFAFGTLIHKALVDVNIEGTFDNQPDLGVLPSQENQHEDDPEGKLNYFRGGPIVRYSANENTLDCLQLEAPKYLRGNHPNNPNEWNDDTSKEARKKYARAITKSIFDYARNVNIWPEGYYMSLNGLCNHESHRILNLEECNAAAEALTGSVASQLSEASHPKGCYFDKVNNVVKYNLEGVLDSMDDELEAICDSLLPATCTLDYTAVTGDFDWSSCEGSEFNPDETCQVRCLAGSISVHGAVDARCFRGELILNDLSCEECNAIDHCGGDEGVSSVVSNLDRDQCICNCNESTEWEGIDCKTCPTNYDATENCSECALGFYHEFGTCKQCTYAEHCTSLINAASATSNDDHTGCICECKDGWSGESCDICDNPAALHRTEDCTSCMIGYYGFPNCRQRQYYRSTDGICRGSSIGTSPEISPWIQTDDECELAYERLSIDGDADGNASITKNSIRPWKCYYRESSLTRALWFNKNKLGSMFEHSGERTALCRYDGTVDADYVLEYTTADRRLLSAQVRHAHQQSGL